jgi:hypothetical protein
MFEVADGDPGLAGDVVEAQPLCLAGKAKPLADRLAQQMILVRFRHRCPVSLPIQIASIEPGTMGKVNRSAARPVL